MAALRGDGWRRLTRDEHPNGGGDPFGLQDDVVLWVIARHDRPAVLELEFHAFGDLGQRTRQLRDILYCQIVGAEDKLYFDKREKLEWRENLSRFVVRLKEYSQH